MTTPAAPDTVNSVGATDDASKGGLFNTLNNTTLSTLEQAIATKATNAATSATNAKISEDNAAATLATILSTGLNSLADVNINSIADNQLLSYDSSTSKFINAKLDFNNIASGVVLDSDTMSGTSATTLATSESIKAYVDAQVTAQDLDFQGDAGGALSIDLDSESLILAGGTGITTTGSNNTMTFAIDSTVATLADNQILTTKTINADNNTISNLEVDNLKSGVLDTDLNNASSNDDTLASAKAIKAYVDSREDAHDELSELTDVTITGTPADNELLAYDTSTSKWINQTSAEASLQPLDAGLTSISGLTTAADKMIYTTGSDTYAVTALTSAGRAILDDADAAAQRTTLGLGATAVTGVDDSTIEISSSNLRVKADGINDTHIDFGTGTDQVSSADVPEQTNLYYTDARARASVSATDGGGDGSFAYNSSTGAFTYTGPSASEVRAHISVTDSGGDGSLAYSNGVITYTGPSASEVRAHLSAGTGLTYSSGAFAIDSSVVTESSTDTLTNKTLTSPVLNVGVSGTAIKDEDNMSSNSATHLATQQSIKAYVDSVAEGLDVKNSVRVTTTANITLANTQTIDGVSLSAGDRVLVKDQSTGSQNGVYVVVNGGSWTRATDFDSNTEVTDGTFFFVEQGTLYADSGWVLTTNNPITVGSTALVFSQFSGAGQITAGTGLSKSGNTINADDATTSAKGIASFNTNHFTVSSGAVSVKTLNQSTTGNAATATALASSVNIGGVSFDGSASINLPGVNATGNQNTSGSAATLTTSRNIGGVAFNGSANINLPGVNTAGNQNTSGNAATATALANARTIGGVSFDGTANINLPGVNASGNQNTSGNAATATALETGRTINGTSFDGTGNITVTSAAGTLTGNTLASGVTASSLTSVGTIATGVWNGTAIADAYISSASTWNAKQDALTFGIANTNAVKINDADAADNDYAKLTASGIEGRSYAEVISDIGAIDTAGTGLTKSSSTLSVNASQTQISALGTIGTGTWQATDIAIAHGGTGSSTASGARTNLGLGTAAVLNSVDEDNMASNSATLLPTQQSVKAYVDANAGGNPTGAQTGMTSILNNNLVVGRDADNQIKFNTDNNIVFRAGGQDQIKLIDGALAPGTDNDIDLGTSSLQFKNAYFDGTVITDAITNGGNLTTSGYIFQNVDNNFIYFGANFEVSLRHVHNTGLLLNSDNQLQFGDSGTYIHQSADGVLDLVSDTEIELNATTVDINGAVDMSSTLNVAGATVLSGTVRSVGNFDVNTNKFIVNATSGNTEIAGTTTLNDDVTFTGANYNVLWDKSDNALEFADNAKAVFGAGSDTSIVHDASNTLINHSGTGDLKIQHGGADQLVVSAAGVTIDETLTTRGLIVTQQAKGISAFNYRYIRISNWVFQSSNVYVREIKFNTAADGSGTEYPSNMTANNAPSPYVASSNYEHSATYAAWKAFTDADAGGGWWNIGSGLSTDYIQIDLGASFNANLNRIDIDINPTYSAKDFIIKASATGSFSGEEVTIAVVSDRDINANSGVTTLRSDQGAAFTFQMEGATPDAFETTLAVVDPTADRTLTLPDSTGIVATTNDVTALAIALG